MDTETTIYITLEAIIAVMSVACNTLVCWVIHKSNKLRQKVSKFTIQNVQYFLWLHADTLCFINNFTGIEPLQLLLWKNSERGIDQ